MTRQEKRKYYGLLIQLEKKYIEDDGMESKYNRMTENLGSYYFKYVKSNINPTDMYKVKNEVYKNSKLSALRNGFLRTVEKIDKSLMNYEKKQRLLYEMIDIYYPIYEDFMEQISMVVDEVEQCYPGITRENKDAMVYMVHQKNKNMKRR